MGRLFISAFIFTFMIIVVVKEARAVEYELPDINGQIQSLDQYKGKWLVVNYWATWCGTCMKELPELVDFHENNAQNAVVVGINFEDIETEKLKEFINVKTIPYTILNTEPVEITPIGKVPALPVTYIINPEGEVVAGEIGIVTRENLETYIAQQEDNNG